MSGDKGEGGVGRAQLQVREEEGGGGGGGGR